MMRRLPAARRLEPRAVWTAGLILLAAAALWFHDLNGRALWWDEIGELLITRQNLHDLLVTMSALPGPRLEEPELAPPNEPHPPLFPLSQHAWIGLMGTSDFAMRFPNVACAVLALALLYPLGRRLDGPPTARLAMFLVVLSPFWLMYARTARYYALTALVGLAATLAFLAVLRRPTVGRWAAYGVATALLPYTNYIAGVLVLAQALYLFWARPGRRWLLTWAGVVMAAGLAFLPWLPVWRAQTALLAAAAPADLAVSPLGLALKLGFPFLSFTAGETTFPWEAPALISYAALSFLFGRGLLALARPSRRAALIVIWLALPVLATALILTFVTPTIPFITVGYRLLFAFPYAVLPMAAGLSRLGRAGRAGLLAALVLAQGYGVYNYFAGRSYLNPIYAVPTESVVADVAAHSQPGDLILSDVDTGFSFYYLPHPQPGVAHAYLTEPATAALLEQMAAAVAAGQPPAYRRIFVLTYGRDRTRRDPPPALTALLAPPAQLVWEQGYVPQDETYRQVKERLLGRSDYRYKLLVQLYQLP